MSCDTNKVLSPYVCPYRTLNRMYSRPMLSSAYQCALLDGFYCVDKMCFPDKCPLHME